MLIDRLNPPDKNYFKISQDVYFLAARRLSRNGLICYSYCASRVPHTWEGKTNPDNKRHAPYELSTSAISKACYIDTDGAKDGIINLIKNKYLTLINGNLYQFRDILPEDRLMAPKQYEEKMAYEEMIKAGQNILNNEIQDELKRRAISNVIESKEKEEEKSQEKEKEKEEKIEQVIEEQLFFEDWMDENDREILRRIREREQRN